MSSPFAFNIGTAKASSSKKPPRSQKKKTPQVPPPKFDAMKFGEPVGIIPQIRSNFDNDLRLSM